MHRQPNQCMVNMVKCHGQMWSTRSTHLVLVIGWGCAPFQVAHVGAFLSHDECALKLCR